MTTERSAKKSMKCCPKVWPLATAVTNQRLLFSAWAAPLSHLVSLGSNGQSFVMTQIPRVESGAPERFRLELFFLKIFQAASSRQSLRFPFWDLPNWKFKCFHLWSAQSHWVSSRPVAFVSLILMPFVLPKMLTRIISNESSRWFAGFAPCRLSAGNGLQI